MNQLTTCSVFRLEGFGNKWWAFKQMQLGITALQNIDGLQFSKILGSGAKNGFSAIPNFGTYVLLCVWKSEKEATVFFEGNDFFKTYQRRSTENFTVYANSAESHGFWDGKKPFSNEVELQADQPILVLTRARIRFKKLISFWRNVGSVSQSLDHYQGVAFSIGIGEWPLIQQATISIWKSQTEMMDYAYKNQEHKRVVKLTREMDWYKEEMFARFRPYKLEGRWGGQEASQLLEG